MDLKNTSDFSRIKNIFGFLSSIHDIVWFFIFYMQTKVKVLNSKNIYSIPVPFKLDKRDQFGTVDHVTYYLKRRTLEDPCFTLPQVTYILYGILEYVDRRGIFFDSAD